MSGDSWKNPGPAPNVATVGVKKQRAESSGAPGAATIFRHVLEALKWNIKEIQKSEHRDTGIPRNHHLQITIEMIAKYS